MADLVVRLYDLPDYDAHAMARLGITIRRALAPERRLVTEWIASTFHEGWAAECEIGFGAHPISVWIATRGNELLGFAAADATAKGFFGPTGVASRHRGQGIGEALLYVALRGMRDAGYAYAIIGDPGPIEFYRKRVVGLEIPNSAPGLYRGMLSREHDL